MPDFVLKDATFPFLIHSRADISVSYFQIRTNAQCYRHFIKLVKFSLNGCNADALSGRRLFTRARFVALLQQVPSEFAAKCYRPRTVHNTETVKHGALNVTSATYLSQATRDTHNQSDDLPRNVDWRLQGLVTPVKDQVRPRWNSV